MSNLLEKASILTTPTAYDNGKLLSVKPVQTFGSELVTNGTFDTDSNWSFDNVGGTKGWRIADNRAICDVSGVSNGRNLQQYLDIPVTSGKKYKISLDILQSDDNILLFIGGQTLTLPTGTNLGYETTFVASSTSTLITFFASTSDTQEIDNVSIKEQTDADFDFTRGSSATRVNAQGLVEDVQILSSNLVQNGDFSQEGAELITNGNFDTDSDWSKGTGWSISGGKGIVTNATANSIYQDVLTLSKSYKASFTISSIENGSLKIGIGLNFSQEFTEVGTYTYYGTPSNDSLLRITPSNGANATIDNVSVKEVGQDWVLGSGITIEENKAIFTSTASGQSVSQNAVASSLTNGALAKVSFEVLTRTEGSFGVYFSGTLVGTLASAGVFTAYFTKGTETSFYIRALGTTSGSISNISVVEITDDTNLPRIDYTGGEGHWLFEPQSTNLVTYSEDFSSASWGKLNIGTGTVAVTSNQGVSPNGDLTADRIQFNLNGGVSASDRAIIRFNNSDASNRILTFYLKSFNGIDQQISLHNGAEGVPFTVTSDWKRFDFVIPSGFNFQGLGLLGSRGVDSSDLLVWGAQLEASSYATSYIPTEGSIKTRLQDAAFGAGSSDLINSTEGVLYFEGLFLSDGFKFVSLNSGSATNRVSIYSSSQSTIGYNVRNSNGNQMNGNFVIGSTINHKCALKFKENDFALWIDGVEVVTDNIGTTFSSGTLNELSYNDGVVGSSNFFGKAKCVAVFKEALTDAELTCLTTI